MLYSKLVLMIRKNSFLIVVYCAFVLISHADCLPAGSELLVVEDVSHQLPNFEKQLFDFLS